MFIYDGSQDLTTMILYLDTIHNECTSNADLFTPYSVLLWTCVTIPLFLFRKCIRLEHHQDYRCPRCLIKLVNVCTQQWDIVPCTSYSYASFTSGCSSGRWGRGLKSSIGRGACCCWWWWLGSNIVQNTGQKDDTATHDFGCGGWYWLWGSTKLSALAVQ